MKPTNPAVAYSYYAAVPRSRGALWTIFCSGVLRLPESITTMGGVYSPDGGIRADGNLV